MFSRATFCAMAALLVAICACDQQPAPTAKHGTSGLKADLGSGSNPQSDDDDSASGSASGSGSGVASGSGSGSGSGTASAEEAFVAETYDDAKAIQWLVDNCASCHKPGAANDSAWPMGATADFTLAKLGADVFAPNVYATLANKFLGLEQSSPKGMPFGPSLTADLKAQLAGILIWFNEKFETSAADGRARLGGVDLKLNGPEVTTHYKCANLPHRDAYLRRVMADLYDKIPSEADIAHFYPAADASKTADAAYRQAVLKEIFKPGTKYNIDFNTLSLTKFAAKVSGANGIVTDDSFDAATVADLKKEFFQLLTHRVQDTPFKEILLGDKVWVTKNTARLYSAACDTAAQAATATWTECQLGPDRSNFFGSLGYLGLWQSSFLRNNNNYTRVAHMYTVLSGEALQPKTNGPAGGTTVPGLDCLKSKDIRGKLADPANTSSALAKNGTLAVPRVGVFCQSCHIGRNLANGSIAFRSFGLHGEPITKADILAAAPQSPDPTTNIPKFYDQVKEAAQAGRVFIDGTDAAPTLVTVASAIPRLADLLDVSEDENKGCIVSADAQGNKTQKVIRTIGDMVGEVVGDGKILVQGLARHIPRAFGNQALTNQEILSALTTAYASGGGKLYPLFQAYLATESYACMRSATTTGN